MMKSALLPFLFVIALGQNSLAKESALPKLDSQGSVSLPMSTVKALKALGLGDFSPVLKDRYSEDIHSLFDEPGAAPQLMFGDFNGDGKKDAVVIFENKTDNAAVLFIEENGKMKAFKVDRWKKDTASKTEMTYLSLLSAAEGRFELGKVKTKRDLIQIETYMGAVNAFYFDGGKLVPYKGKVP